MSDYAELDPAGIEAVVVGFDDFMRKLGAMEQGLTDLSKKIGAAAGDAALSGARSGIILAGVAAGVVGTAVSIGTAVTSAATAVWLLTEKLAGGAAALENMEAAGYNLGQRFGYTIQQMDATNSALERGGVGAMEAVTSVNALTRKYVDLGDTQKLLGVAQDAAALSGKKVSDTYGQLATAISTTRTATLRNLGINVDATDEYRRMAAQLGTTSEQLTEQQRVQAILNAVMREGANITGAYASVMDLPARRLERIQGLTESVSLSIGQRFVGALGAGAKALEEIWTNVERAVRPIDNMSLAVSDSGEKFDLFANTAGKLYPIIDRVGAALQVASEWFGNLAREAAIGAINIIASVEPQMESFAERALTWGANVVAQFAQGMVEGAVGVLTAAMDYIGGLLAYWLAPGSPPNVAPGMRDWGMAAMTQWLEGFGEADFSILSSLESSLSSVFKSLGDMGLDTAAIGITMEDATAGIMHALDTINKGGATDYGIVEKLRTSLGQYGQEVSELVKLQLDLAAAMNGVEKAQEAVNKAREAESAADTKIRSLVAEYNKMLRSGASKEALKAKLAEVKASGQDLATAQKKRAEEEKAAIAAQKTADDLKKKVSLQQQLVQQLIKLNDLLTPKLPAAGLKTPTLPKEAKKPGAGIPKPLELPPLKGPLITPTINTATFDAMKKKLEGIFEPISGAIEVIKGKLGELAAKWTWFTGLVTQAWLKLMGTSGLGGFAEFISKLFPPDFAQKVGQFVGALLAIAGVGLLIKTAFSLIAGAIGLILSPIVRIGALVVGAVKGIITVFGGLPAVWARIIAIGRVVVGVIGAIVSAIGAPVAIAIAAVIAIVAILAAAWANNWFGIRDTLTAIWNNNILPALQGIWTWLSTNIPAAIAAVVGWWNGTLIPAFQAAGNFITGTLVPAFQSVWTFLSETIPQAIGTVLAPIGQLIGQLIQLASNIINGVLVPAFQHIWEFITGSLVPLLTSFAGLVGDVLSLAFRILVGALTTVYTGMQTVWNFIVTLFQPILNTISLFVTGTLIPAFQAVWDMMYNYWLPVFQSVWNFLVALFLPIIQSISTFITGTLIPAVSGLVTWVGDNLLKAFTVVWDFLVKKLIPIFGELWEWLTTKLAESITNFIKDKLQPLHDTFEAVMRIVEKVCSWIEALRKALNGLTLPSWLTPGSPTPFELGLNGINQAMEQLAKKALPKLEASLTLSAVKPSASPVAGVVIPASQTRNSTVNINMGTVTISNGLDQATFTNAVKRAVMEAL